MQTKLAALVVVSIFYGLTPVYAAENSTNVSKPESHDLRVPAPQMSIAMGTSQPSSAEDGPLRKSPDPECEEQMPSTGAATALLNRLVRSSTTARGVQCPIPPVPDKSTLEEFHP
jgi:hypothetical protein